MNLMLVHRDVLVTPPLADRLLAGITCDGLLRLARRTGIRVREERIPSDERAFWADVRDVFSSGTAAGTTHVRSLDHAGERLFQRAAPGPVALELGQHLSAIQRGEAEDPAGWRSLALSLPGALTRPG
ncbi:MAG: aminotransferase class IV [Planctomycetota bacterium]|nr:aminotransferase class IV [Planctomycetota bacterium]